MQYLRLNLMHSLFRYILGTQLCQEIIFFHKKLRQIGQGVPEIRSDMQTN